jgi:hypothetical protein
MSDGTFYWRKYGNERGTLPDGEESIYFDTAWERDSEPPKGVLSVFVHNYLSAGDYSSNDGGIVRANVDAFHEQIGDEYLGQLFWSIHGGHGYFGIAVHSDVLDEDSALYAAGDEELINAANSIREIIEALDQYPILDESAHSELEMNQQQEQFPDAASDVYVSGHGSTQVLHALVAEDQGVQVRHGRTSFAGLIAVVLGNDIPKEARDRLVNDWGEHVGGLQSFYYGISDMFSIYPETEGSGDNIAVLFRFDQFASDLLDSIASLRGPGDAPLIPGAVPILGSMIIDGIFDENPATQHAAFTYNSKVYNMIRTGRDISRMNETEYAIFADSVQANPGRAILLATEGKLIETAKAGPLAGLKRRRR